MKYRYFVAVFMIAIFLVVITPSNVIAAAPPSDEYVHYEIPGEPQSVDPAVDYETAGGEILQNVYETLLTYDGNSTDLVPNLATTMPTISSDAKSFTFTLRNDVYFTDGVHFDAYVMKYSIDRVILMNDPNGPAWMLGAIKGANTFMRSNMTTSDVDAYLTAGGVQVIDQYTIKFNLDDAYVAFVAALMFTEGSPVSPLAVISHMPSDYTSRPSNETQLVTMAQMFPNLNNIPSWYNNFTSTGIVPGEEHPWMAGHAVGTGPYILQSITSGVGRELVRNDNWWKAKAGIVSLPPMKAVHIQLVADTNTRILALKDGEADSAQIPATNLPDIYNLTTRTVTASGLRVDLVPTFSVTYFGFNMNETLPSGTLTASVGSTYDASKQLRWGPHNSDTRNASQANPFTALNFRKAFAYSFDYDTFINIAANGYGQRMIGTIPEGMFGHDSALAASLPDYNIATAKALFQSVGWQGTIHLSYNSGNDVRKAGCELLAAAINGMGVGINVVVDELEWSNYLDLRDTRQLPIFFLGWAPDFADPDDYINPFLYHSGTNAKGIAYNNSLVDELIVNATTMTNTTTRTNTYHTIEEYAAEDYPIIYGIQALRAIVSQDHIQGVNGFTSNPMVSDRAYWELSKTSTAGPIPGFEFSIVLSLLGVVAVIALIRKHKQI